MNCTIKPSFPPLPTGCTSRVQFSADGNLILTLGSSARVWDSASGQPVTPEIKTSPGEHAVSLSPDGKLIAVIERPRDDKYGVKVFSVEREPRLVGKLEVPAADFVQFDPYSERLLVVSETGARVWNVAENRPLFKEVPLENRSGSFSSNFLCAEVSPLGDIFVTTRLMNDHCARVWHMDTGEPWAPPLVHKSRVQCIAFNKYGKYLVTGSADATARVWNTLTGQPVTVPLPHKGQVAEISVSDDYEPLSFATITDGFSDDMWWEISAEAVKGGPLRCHAGTNKFGCVAFAKSGSRIAVGNHHVHESHGNGKTGACWWLIDARTFKPLVPAMEAEWHVRQIAFSPDCRRLVVGCGWAYGGRPGCATVYEIGEGG
jgi:WD40 repeat protein